MFARRALVGVGIGVSLVLPAVPVAAHEGYSFYLTGNLAGCHHQDSIYDTGLIHCKQSLRERDAKEAVDENWDEIATLCESFGAEATSRREVTPLGLSDTGFSVLSFRCVASIFEQDFTTLTLICDRQKWSEDYSCTHIQTNGSNISGWRDQLQQSF